MSRALVFALVTGVAALGAASGAQAATISGTPGNDVIRGTQGRDTIRTFSGNDIVYGGGGDDVVDTGPGRDVARGQSGDDFIEGGDDRDILYGGASQDTLLGEGARDILHLRDGVERNDAGDGGHGFDICHGDDGDRLSSCESGGGSSPGGSGTGPGGEDVASGRCHMTGRITFRDPVGFPPEFTTFTDYAEGTCTGTVNGKFMANERAFLRVAGGGLLSCGANRVVDPGVMTFTRNTATRADDVEIDYVAYSQGAFGQVASRIRGRVSGEAVASVRFRGDEQAAQDCAAGRFRGGVYDTDSRTITPLVG